MNCVLGKPRRFLKNYEGGRKEGRKEGVTVRVVGNKGNSDGVTTDSKYNNNVKIP